MPATPPSESSFSGRSRLRKDRSPTIQSRDSYRPLLPCPQVLKPPPAPTLEGHGASNSERPTRSARNNVTLACNECKAKKARCDGKYPCTRCTLKGLHCLFDSNRDRRRVRGIPAENLILREMISQYQRLFTIMHNTSAKEAVGILHLLRSCSNDIQQSPGNASGDLPLDKLLQLVEQFHQGSGSPESIYGAKTPTTSPNSTIQMLPPTSANQQQSKSICSSSEHSCHHQTESGSSSTASPTKDSPLEATALSNWPAIVKTDLEQVTTWLNQDIDAAANALRGRQSSINHLLNDTTSSMSVGDCRWPTR